jgi:hypothetical protein
VLTVPPDDYHAFKADQAKLISTGRNFFIFAVLAVAAAVPLIHHYNGKQNRILFLSAGFVGHIGWASTYEVRRRINRIPQDVTGGETLLEVWGLLAVFAAFLALYATTIYDNSPFNAHVRQAFAFIHGHTWVDAPNYIEHANFNGRSYQLHPPMPAFLLVPFVAVWGMDTSQSIANVIMAALDVAFAWLLLGRMKVTLNSRVWLTIFFGAGTILWHEAVDGGSWEMSMVVAVAFTMLALAEVFGEARPGIVGLTAGLASLARYDLAFIWPIWTLLTYLKRRDFRRLMWLSPGFGLAAAIYAWFNMVRYGGFFDRGVFVFVPDVPKLFSFGFLPTNLYTLLFMAPSINHRFPYIHPEGGGQALVLTSPAFILALRPSFRRLVPGALLVATLIAMTPSLFYFTNGFVQYGTRHYVHVFPFLFALMALGLPDGKMDQLTRILIGWSVFLIAFGVWHIGIYGYGGG